MLFVGGFRHRPNIDAMTWFIDSVWPRVQAAVPGAKLNIVGPDPPREILGRASDAISVAGAISDEALVGLYASNQVAIAPMRFGAGVKGKVIEALSHGVPVVSTSFGVQGVKGASDFVAICDDAEPFARAITAILNDFETGRGRALAGLDFLARTCSEAAARQIMALDIPELANPATPGARAMKEPAAS
jgi:glycosyltransferase involved in cell wall biosynthesis